VQLADYRAPVPVAPASADDPAPSAPGRPPPPVPDNSARAAAPAGLVAAGLGGCGTILRFLVDATVSERSDRDFPYGTLLVNLSGSALLGVTVGPGLRGSDATLIGAATIGAYTTFSTWMLETQRLAEEGNSTGAAANLLVSLTLGLLAAGAGRAIGAHL